MLSLNKSTNDTSITLDLLRAIAAQMVCVGHALYFFTEWRPAGPLMQNVGVLLFFALSGFLIAYTLTERSKNPAYGFWQFFIERFARIYSGLVPALIFVAVLDGAVIYFSGDPASVPSYSGKIFLDNLLMLEGYRGINLITNLHSAVFGSAAPLWTLVVEWHIYMFVGALFFMGAKPRLIPWLIPVALFFGQTSTHFLLGSVQDDGVGRGLFMLWLGGAYVFFAARTAIIPYLPAVGLTFISAVCYVLLTPPQKEYDFRTYTVLLIFVFAVVMASQAKHFITSARVVSIITFFAGYSFTLYLIHYTIFWAIHVLSPGDGTMKFICSILLSNGIAAVIASQTEMKHKSLARFLKQAATRYRAEPSEQMPPRSATDQG
ncbi:acyltransferase family protein [Bradyrhizobium canariense]|uniref:Peptidoglycan/LPS O-acetylase OafA/YrhL, contains acyltransferase and SGNH-hydrolase domains n=1 Tax=Bradyrhizobium canariense TaxID=255045 RepID=A0A1H1UY15_9BRAD|nr:acyltransferase [Bradyrhizobium canariense]SDS77405.1 Peptidoglycan/LPS O-acetylase OafA/YrhL, contains acyltransferase and SGNH-hydrolase domains [Bradyrhizobium canariense]